MALLPCPGCSRHVRASEATCPFCSSELPQKAVTSNGPSPGVRLGRAALFAFGTSLALSACATPVMNGDTGSTTDAAGPDTGGNMALYGGPPVEAGTQNDAGLQAMYGTPPPDDGGPSARYGAPPVNDT